MFVLGAMNEAWELGRPMQDRLIHGWDDLLWGTGMEHADKGMTSTTWGSLAILNGNGEGLVSDT